MLWRVKPWRGHLWALAACGGLLATPAAGAGPAPTLAHLQADDAALAAKSRAAVLDLYSLDERLAAAGIRLAALQGDEARLGGERALLARELGFARLDSRLSESELAARLRSIYAQGPASPLDLMMGATTLGDALSALDDYNRLAASNAEVLLQVRTAQHRLARVARALALRGRELAATTSAAAETVSELAGLRAAQESYLAGLEQQRSLDAARIATLTAQAEAAVARSQRLAPTPPPAVAASAPPAPPAATAVRAPVSALGAAPAAPSPSTPVGATAASADGTTMTVVATAYDLPGNTSTGLPVGWGIAAVDPSVIPLGTHMVVPGYGEAVAADTGVSGATIDLWFPTLAQANAWGRRTITIVLN